MKYQPILILTGCNDFGVPGATLRGCVNDDRNQWEFAHTVYPKLGWKVYPFINRDNVAQRVRECLDMIGNTVKKGQIVDFQNSSHGSKYQGEYLTCAYKFDWSRIAETFISGRQYFDRFKKIVERGGLLSFHNDACNSGDLNGLRMSLCGPPRDTVVKSIECPLLNVGADKDRFDLAKAIVSTQLDMVYESGSGPRETDYSEDVVGSDGRAYGAFTEYRLKAVRANRGKTFKQIHTIYTDNLARDQFPQVPELHGGGVDRIYLPE